MKRGTMMVLKRLLVTALGALGLSALATGPTFAQQLPAPDLYTDITACAGGMLPTSPTAMGAMGLLGMALAGDRSLAAADIDETEEAGLSATLDLSSTACTANPVAGAYQQAVNIYNEYVAAKAALPGADADPDPDATARYNRAKAARDAFGGEVFDEVYNQRMQITAVDGAIDDYNALVGDGGSLAALKTSYDTIIVNDLGTGTNDPGETGDDPSWNQIYGSMGIRGYQAIEATAFDDAGVLQLGDAADTTITTLGGIVTELMTRQDAVDTAQENVDNAVKEGNLNPLALRETLRRATKARDHVQAELTRLSSIIRAQNRDLGTDTTITVDGDTVTLAETEREVLTEYGKIQTQVDGAAAKVRSTVTALERANNAVKNALSSPDDYLDQLVALRQFQKDAADAAVADAGASPAPSLVSAAEDAAKALTAAMGQRDAHADLTGDPDSPASALLSALLEPPMKDGEPNPADDDGRAVIDAIATTYGVAKGAADEAQRVVDELTGEGGQVAMNTADIAENKAMLADHETRISDNETMIGAHSTMLMDHEMRISTNASEIMRVEGRVDSNWDAIAENQTAIGALGGRVGANEMAIGDLNNRVGSNASAIQRNSGMISDLNDSLEVVRAGVAASMALAGMPAINGRGVSIGVGSYDGESAFAVGFQIQGEMASFKVGVTSAGGETGASAGVGFQF